MEYASSWGELSIIDHLKGTLTCAMKLDQVLGLCLHAVIGLYMIRALHHSLHSEDPTLKPSPAVWREPDISDSLQPHLYDMFISPLKPCCGSTSG